jgi:hypothetical protein
MPANGTTERPARYFTDQEIACLVHHVRLGLAEITRGLPLASYALEEHIVSAVRAGAGRKELLGRALAATTLEAELVTAAVVLMAGSER